jgi:D-beta-D-heptose 7-phosphate kinase/D-beta-D-heptose 1-phosphate adenosyltransferase
MSQEIREILDRFPAVRILAIGDLMLDQYWWGIADRISPEAPVPVVRKMRASSAPGGAANSAANAAALSAAVTVIGVVGEDAAGDELRKVLSARRIECSDIITSPGRPTTVKTRILAHNQQVARVDEEDTSPLDAALSDRVARNAERVISSIDAVLVSDYAKGLLTEQVLSRVISRALAAGVPVIVDPKRSDVRLYSGATVIKPNRTELACLTGLPARNHLETIHAARSLADRMATTAVVVTEGDDGMSLVRAGMPEMHFPTAARQVYDVTGAGDTAIATLTVALAAGADLAQSVWLANLAAGLAIGEIGTATISRADLDAACQSSAQWLDRMPAFPESRGRHAPRPSPEMPA